jgi:adenylate cyclase
MDVNILAEKPFGSAVRKQLARIMDSKEFSESPRSKELLAFVVGEKLGGSRDKLSQRTIAQCVYGRNEQFDPTCDPIVRMQAGRVRRQLEHYYLTVGVSDPILIKLPKRTYVPEFETQTQNPESMGWPTLLIQPFVNLSNQPETELLALGLPSDLAAEFNLYSDIEVFLPSSAATNQDECPTQFLLEGTVSLHQQELRVNVHLLDRASRRQIWAHRHHCSSINNCLEETQQMIQMIAASIAEERGHVTRWMDKEISGQRVTVSGTYEAILSYHRYDRAPSEETYVLAFNALQSAVELVPDSGICYSYLARLMTDAWALVPADDSINAALIVATARKGVKLDPDNRRGRLILAYIYLLTDDLEECRSEAQTARKAVQNGRGIWLDVIGYLLTLCGDWDRGPKLIRKGLAINPYPIDLSSAALWVDALRRNDIDEMLKQSFIFEKKGVLWEPLMRAVSLVLAGRIPEAEPEAKRILQCCPDFTTRGKWYIERYIKFEPLVERIIQGLSIAGVVLPQNKSST